MTTSSELGFLFNFEPEAAVLYLQNKGYKITTDWRELWEDAHAQAFTVSKMTDMELLKETKTTLEMALKEGWSSQKTQRELTYKFKEKGWWGKEEIIDENGKNKVIQLGSPFRVRTIYRQNIQAAYNAGRWQEQMRNVDFAPYLQYICVLDDHTRPEHRTMHLKVFRYDDEIWAYFYPPNGWGCRCTVRQLTQADVDRMGLKVESSEKYLSFKDVIINDETGETKQVAVFKTKDLTGNDIFMQTDAGWSYNVGQAAWNIDVLAYNSIKTLPQNIKDRFISEMAENIYNKSVISNLIKDTLARTNYKSLGLEKPIGWFSPEIIHALENENIRLQTPIIVFEDRQVRHSLGNVKVAKQQLSKSQFSKIYDYIHHPDEIFIDTQELAIVYVKFLPKEEIIEGRNCIKIPVPINVNNSRRPINFIGTTARIPYQNTFGGKQTRYKKIK